MNRMEINQYYDALREEAANDDYTMYDYPDMAYESCINAIENSRRIELENADEDEKPTLTLYGAIDFIFSHNERIALWARDEDDPHYSDCVWEGMAHQLPAKFYGEVDWRIKGIVPADITDADLINIELRR